MNDTSDDISYYQLSNPTSISGYSIGDIIPLVDGWVIISDLNTNRIIIMNGITGEVAKKYQLNASPMEIEFDFDNNFILATQGTSKKIAKIDVMSGAISYIATSYAAKTLTMGENNQLFVCTQEGIFNDNKISLIDLKNNVELKSFPFTEDSIGFIKYDKVFHNLFLGVEGISPSYLYRYSYDAQNQLLNYIEKNWNPGSNGQDLAVSNDGLHLAFVCGGGNSSGYGIDDFDPSDIQNNNGDGTSTTPRYKNVWFQGTLGFKFY